VRSVRFRLSRAAQVMALAVAVTACQAVTAPPSGKIDRDAGPPVAPGPTYPSGGRLAEPKAGDLGGLSEEQIALMFEKAVEQIPVLPEQKAICVGLQGLSDRVMHDGPSPIIARLSRELGLPSLPASQCSADVYPFVAQSRAQAILYTVKVERGGRTTLFTAMAMIGNLGAKGTQYQLIRGTSGRWHAKPTGLTILS
jgi:hypothetical protein